MANTLRASQHGLDQVEKAMDGRGWKRNSIMWQQAADTSEATLKRFWRKTPIKRLSFIRICEAVGVNWTEIAEGNNVEEIKQSLVPISPILLEPDPKPIAHKQIQSFALPEKIAPVRNWVGRSREIDTLKSQILDPETRAITITAVCLVGLAGIGKTTLASQLVRQLQAENAPFTVAAWEILKSSTGRAPKFDIVINSLLLTLGNGEITPTFIILNDYRQKTDRLVKFLKEKPCLVVLDNVETVLQIGKAKRAGYFADEYAEYAWLFSQIAETEHQSKVLFTSRETLAALSGRETQTLRLGGLDLQAAVQLLESFNLIATPEELAELAQRYDGHPKALEIVAALILNEVEYQER